MELSKASPAQLRVFEIPFQLPLEDARSESIVICHIPFNTRILLSAYPYRGFYTVVDNFLAEARKGGFEGLKAYRAVTQIKIFVGHDYATLHKGTTFGSSGRFHHQTIVITPSHRS